MNQAAATRHTDGAMHVGETGRTSVAGAGRAACPPIVGAVECVNHP